MVVLPTGLGKSLIFQLLVLMLEVKSKMHMGEQTAAV